MKQVAHIEDSIFFLDFFFSLWISRDRAIPDDLLDNGIVFEKTETALTWLTLVSQMPLTIDDLFKSGTQVDRDLVIIHLFRHEIDFLLWLNSIDRDENVLWDV